MNDIVIRNCNNINEALISIENNKLNIKFALNGTGKSTIAKALSYNDISLLKPFGKNITPYINGNEKFKNVLLFDSNFVNTIVFNGSNVIDNSFEIFIKNDKYDEQKENINKLLEDLKRKIGENDDLKKLNEQLILLSLKMNYKKEKNSIDSRGMYLSIKSDNNIYRIPKELSKYSHFLLNKDINISWADWKNKGENYDDGLKCPYCVNTFDNNHEEENIFFKNYYTKANVSNLTEFSEILDNTKKYLAENGISKIYDCIKKDITNEEKDLIFTKFMSEVMYLKEKINNINTFDSYKVKRKELSNLSNIMN